MRVIIASIAAAIVVAVVGLYGFDSVFQETSDQAYSSSTTVRLPHEESGHNLVGKDWSSAKQH